MEKKYPIEYTGIPESRLMAEKFFEEEFAKLTDIARRHEVSQEKETWISCYMAGHNAATPQGIGWVNGALPTISGEYYCKCKVDGEEKRLIVEFDKNGQWGEAPGYDYYEDFEIIEWLDETGQSQQPGREVKP
jgi:hypothetical protein